MATEPTIAELLARITALEDEKFGITPAKAEEILIRRGAIKITLDI